MSKIREVKPLPTCQRKPAKAPMRGSVCTAVNEVGEVLLCTFDAHLSHGGYVRGTHWIDAEAHADSIRDLADKVDDLGVRLYGEDDEHDRKVDARAY